MNGENGRIGIQTPNIGNIYDPLKLTDANTPLPGIVPNTLNPVYCLDPAMIAPRILAINTGALSIAAQTRSFPLADQTLMTNTDPDGVDVSWIQLWHFVSMKLTGGTVGTINVNVYLTTRNGAVCHMIQRQVANPGFFSMGATIVYPGWDLVIATDTNGGGGDTAHVWAWGTQVKPGIGVTPSGAYNSYAGGL